MQSRIRSLLHTEQLWAYVLVIGIVLLTYLPLANHLGYYDDDWYVLWTGVTQGWEKIIDLHLFDRPLMGVIYAMDYRLLGNAPVNWQFYGGFLRVVGAVAILWMLRKIWPEEKLATVSVAILATVYPGFLMQPNANTYTNHIISYTFGMISLACTVQALSLFKRWGVGFYTFLAMLFGALNFFTIEYMIGIEAMRVIVIGYILQKKAPASLRENILRLLQRWGIYLVPLLIYLYWRLFIFESGRPSVDVQQLVSGYLSSPIRALLTLMVELAKDFFETSLAAWFVHPYLLLSNATYRQLSGAAIITGTCIGLFLGYGHFFKSSLSMTKEGERHWGRSATWLGALFVIFALAPVIVAGRNVILNHSYTRYTIQAAFGVALLLVGLFNVAMRQSARLWIVSLFLGLATLTHYQNAVFFQEDWEHQKDLWWQVSWRIPDLKPDTVLVIMPSSQTTYSEGYEIWGPANLIYNPDGELNIYGQVLTPEVLGLIARGASDRQMVRGIIPIEREYNNLLLAAFSNPLSCLHVIDGKKVEIGLDAPSIVLLAAPYSRLDRIIPDVPGFSPPTGLFGPEPEHTWCYFYQKIHLALQQGDWEQAAQLADEALSKDYKPLETSEWMPLLEAYANTGREKETRDIAKIIRDDKNLRYFLCTQLSNPPNLEGYNEELIFDTLCEN